MTDRILVVGAGMGGLAAALRLAHAGRDVHVLEAHSGPGGKMRTLPSAAGPVDAGPTVMTMRWVFDALFEEVGARLEDHVTLHRESLLARHWWPDGSTLDLHADPEASRAAIGAFAGSRAAGQFAAFAKQARSLFDTFEGPMMLNPDPSMRALAAATIRRPGLTKLLLSGRSLAQHLAASFDDPRLRQLFGRYATYVGGSPYDSPALLALIWQAEAAGVWRVSGGMHRLALAIEELARSRGAAFSYDSPVARIEIADRRVRGVSLADGTRLDAAQVLFNGDPRAIAMGRLGFDARHAVQRAEVEPRSLSAEVWAFAATPSRTDLVHHNVFFARDPHAEFDPIARGERPSDPTLYVCAQDRGTGAVPPLLERFEIIMNAPPCPDAREATPQEIPPCRTTVFETLSRFGLTFSPAPDMAAATGPQAFDRLFPASCGSLYGRSPHGMTAALEKPRVQTRVPGLFLAGGGVHPGAGIPMATLSGRHAAAAILANPDSMSRSARMAMRGGMSTGSRMTAPGPSRS